MKENKKAKCIVVGFFTFDSGILLKLTYPYVNH